MWNPSHVFGSRPGRRRHVGAAIGAVAALLLGASVAWVLAAARTAHLVSAAWTPTCTGTTVARYQGQPAIRSRPGWRCEVALEIRNGGRRSIHVSGVEVPFLGTDGGAEVRGYSTADAVIRDANAPPGRPAPRFGDVDGVYDVDVDVPAHSTRTVRLVIGWRERGCDAGGHMSFNGWPTVVFERLHRSFRFTPEQDLVLRTYTDLPDGRVCSG